MDSDAFDSLRPRRRAGIRLNKKPPQIYFKKKKTGGITFSTTVPLTHMDERLCYLILHDYKIHNAEVLIREDVTADDFIDVIEGNRRYIRCLYVYNKIDVMSIEEVDDLSRRPYSVPISCSMDLGLNNLLAETWRAMDLRRVYTKKVWCGHRARSRLSSHPAGGGLSFFLCSHLLHVYRQ